MAKTWIYLIKDEVSGLYKIGRSDHPVERLRTLRTQGTKMPTPADLILDEAWYAPADMERHLHSLYAEFRVNGEWFDLSIHEVERFALHFTDVDAIHWSTGLTYAESAAVYESRYEKRQRRLQQETAESVELESLAAN